MSLTKDHIITSTSNSSDLNKSQATKIVETLLEIIKKTLGNGEDVLISRFGKSCAKDKSERLGRNPATDGELLLR